MLKQIVDNHSIEALKKLLVLDAKAVIIPHYNPDGDAFGSTLAWFYLLRALGCDAKIVSPDSAPDFLMWMEGANDIVNFKANQELATQYITEATLIFCLDFNDLKRTKSLEMVIQHAQGKKIVIDHHPYPNIEAEILISHPECSSCCELIYRIIAQMGYEKLVTKNIATSLLVGMITDTGSFSYNSDNADIFKIVASLIEAGASKDFVINKLFNHQTEERFRLMGYVLNEKMKLHKPLKTAIISLSASELQQYNYQQGDTEGFVNIPLSIEGIAISIFFMEKDDEIKFSFRSQGDIAINDFASKYFNGGGHKNAAGGHLTCTFDQAIALLNEKLPLLKEYI